MDLDQTCSIFGDNNCEEWVWRIYGITIKYSKGKKDQIRKDLFILVKICSTNFIFFLFTLWVEMRITSNGRGNPHPDLVLSVEDSWFSWAMIVGYKSKSRVHLKTRWMERLSPWSQKNNKRKEDWASQTKVMLKNYLKGL